MTAKATPSRSVSIAAAVARLAAASLVGGWSIDPEQSTMITSAAEPSACRACPPPVEVTVTIAFTSAAPCGRYSFWKTST